MRFKTTSKPSCQAAPASSAHSSAKADFHGSVFGNGAGFARATFGDAAVGAVFGLNALFLDAVFKGPLTQVDSNKVA